MAEDQRRLVALASLLADAGTRVQVLRGNHTPFALGAPVLALESVPIPGGENWGIRLPEHHATLPDTSRSQTEDARLTFGHNPISE